MAGTWRTLRLKNFRRFEDTGTMHLSPTTMLFGKNSSGKTSILRAMLLMKQLFDAPLDGEVSLSGATVDLGSYRELVFGGDVKRDVEISFDLDPQEGVRFRLKEEDDLMPGLLNSPHVALRLHWNVRDSYTQIDEIVFSSSSDSSQRVAVSRLGPSEFRIDWPFGQAVRIQRPLSFASLRFIHAEMRGRGNREVVQALDYFMFLMMEQLFLAAHSLVHVGPLRQPPDRAYRTKQPGSPGTTKSVIQALDHGQEVQERVSSALRAMGIAENIELQRLAPGYVGVVLREPATEREVNLADVGFGVSQVLPLLVELATCTPGSTVLIEQPELHLHPDAQGELADVLVSLAAERRVGLVMESHSEHILLRLQRRIAEGSLDPDSVAAYFVEDGEVRLAAIREDGHISPESIPSGFFDEDWEDAVKLAMAAAERRGRQ